MVVDHVYIIHFWRCKTIISKSQIPLVGVQNLYLRAGFGESTWTEAESSSTLEQHQAEAQVWTSSCSAAWEEAGRPCGYGLSSGWPMPK